MLALLGCFACGVGESTGHPFHTLALVLIALGVGGLVGIQAGKAECCKKFGKFVGGFIVVASFLMLICMAVCGFKAFKEGCPAMGGKSLPPGHPPVEVPSK